MMITGEANIKAYRQRVLLGALKLELLGMKKRGQSAYSLMKRELGIKGNKQSVYDQAKEIIG